MHDYKNIETFCHETYHKVKSTVGKKKHNVTTQVKKNKSK